MQEIALYAHKHFRYVPEALTKGKKKHLIVQILFIILTVFFKV